MNRYDLLKSMEAIDDDVLEKSAESPALGSVASGQEKRRKGMLKYAWTVGGFAAAALLVALSLRFAGRNSSVEPAAVGQSAMATAVDDAQEGVTIPPKKVNLKKREFGIADMIGFFIYKGHCYEYMDMIFPDPGLPEKYLGTITGMIDEWTPEEGYVDLAGSAVGDFYSVKGYDPSFMLCQKMGTREVILYISNSGITLNKGSDLYTDRLHLKGRIKELQAESRDSWFTGKNEIYRLDKDNEAVTNFIDALNEGSFISREDVPAKDEWHMIFDEREKEHLTFLMEDGTRVRLRLLEGGYVFYQGILDACVQVPEDVMEDILALAESGERIPEEELPLGITRQSLKECREDPVFGKYVPRYMPDGMEATSVVVMYEIDQETGRENGTDWIQIEYSDDKEDPHIYYSVQIWPLSEYEKNGYAGPLLKAEELTEEALDEAMVRTDSKGTPREYPYLDIAAEYGDVMVLLSARGLEADECLKIFESARPE